MLNAKKNDKWNDEEVKILKELYPTASWDEINGKLPKFKKSEIYLKAHKLGINRDLRYYSPEELDYIKENMNKMSPIEIAKELGRTPKGIAALIYNKNIVKRGAWTEEEIEIVKKYYATESNEKIVDRLFYVRSPHSVRLVAKIYGLKKGWIVITRKEHIEWTKERALAYLDRSSENYNLNAAISSIISDLPKHKETENHLSVKLLTTLIYNDGILDHDELETFIKGIK